mmetsp:Transcript_8705/g.16857  ORF Transcript_8705/g.16857 Transcript_8705/m.16857 type:complete len:360 (-) Transcript_8705:27-1106(-)
MASSSSGKRKVDNAAHVPDSPTPEASPSSTSDDEHDERAEKRSRELVSLLSEEYICAITHELMVDPVVADDGNTYERSAIMQWLQTNTKSPLDPSTTIDPSRLIGSRAVFKSIEKLVMSGDIDEDLRKDWFARKKKFDLLKAKLLYDEGRVLEAANLGLPKAQGKVSSYYYHGDHDFEKDVDKCFEFATKAAEAGDMYGQYRLGHLCEYGIGTAKDWRAALKWYGRAAEQQCLLSANNIGRIYFTGGYGIQKDFNAAFTWYEKAAVGGCASAQASLGNQFYTGKGVAKNIAAAWKWYKRSANQEHPKGQRSLGLMMVKGEGCSESLGAGTTLLEKAAVQGDAKALELLSNYRALAGDWS